MRFYSIVISSPKDGRTLVPNPKTRKFEFVTSGKGVSTYASHSDGKFFPSALDVEIDMQVYSLDDVSNGSMIRVWGISIAEVSQSSDLYGLNIDIFAGMQKGLPLANPKQSGHIGSGYIVQAYGNWQGTEQSLDIIMSPKIGSEVNPVNLVFKYPKGALLSDAIQQTLEVAYPPPKYNVQVNLSSALVLPSDQDHVCPTLQLFAQFINGLTSSMNVGDPLYSGVKIRPGQRGIIVEDNSFIREPIKLAGQDFIGQPTWMGNQMLNFSLVLRHDIWPQNWVWLPRVMTQQAYTLTSPGAALPGSASVTNGKTSTSPSSGRTEFTFQGIYEVIGIHHFGRYRQPDGNSWVTVVNAAKVSDLMLKKYADYKNNPQSITPAQRAAG